MTLVDEIDSESRGGGDSIGDSLVSEVDDWLNGRGFSSWGQGFSVVKPDDRRRAAEWFARQYEAFEAYRAGYHGDGTDPAFSDVGERHVHNGHLFEKRSDRHGDYFVDLGPTRPPRRQVPDAVRRALEEVERDLRDNPPPKRKRLLGRRR